MAPDDISLRRKRAEVVVLLVLLSLMSYFQRTGMSIAGPSIARAFFFSETQMGAVYSAFVLGYALFMIPGGGLADRFGPRLVITGVALASAAFTAVAAILARPGLALLVPVLPAFIAIRFALGCSTAPLYPASARMNAGWIPIQSRAWVQGWISAGAGIGGALSPILLTWLIARWGWPSAFLLTGVTTVAIAVLWASRTSDQPPGSAKPASFAVEHVDWKGLLTNRNLMLVTTSYVGTGYFEYIFFYWVFYYLGEIRHVGAAQSAIFTSALFTSWAAMAPLGGRISDGLVRRYGLRRGSRLVPVTGLFASAAFVFIAIGLGNPNATGIMLALALGLAARGRNPKSLA